MSLLEDACVTSGGNTLDSACQRQRRDLVLTMHNYFSLRLMTALIIFCSFLVVISLLSKGPLIVRFYLASTKIILVRSWSLLIGETYLQAKIHPEHPTDNLSDEDCKLLRSSIKEVLNEYFALHDLVTVYAPVL